MVKLLTHKVYDKYGWICTIDAKTGLVIPDSGRYVDSDGRAYRVVNDGDTINEPIMQRAESKHSQMLQSA